MSLITVGVPVYNAMPFLEESVESLLQQTDSDFKILIVDDGSTDGGLKYLRSVNDSRLKVVTQPNRGLTYTLNRMLKEADTPWLMRHDADDVALPRRVEATKRAINANPDAGMFYSEARYYQNGNSVGTFRITRGSPHELRQITARGYLLAICHPTVTLNVQKALTLGGYRFDLHIEDIDLWWRMALTYEICYHSEVTTYFRHNSSSVSAANLELQAINTLYVQYLLLSHLNGWPPLAYSAVREKLSQHLDRPTLACRDALRKANICYSQKSYSEGSKYLVRAVLANPEYFVGRVLYETRSRKGVFNGEKPDRFLQQRALLWPDAGRKAPSSLAGSEAAPVWRGC